MYIYIWHPPLKLCIYICMYTCIHTYMHTYYIHVKCWICCMIYNTRMCTLNLRHDKRQQNAHLVCNLTVGSRMGLPQEFTQGSRPIRSDGELHSCGFVPCRLPPTLDKWVARSKPETLIRAAGMFRFLWRLGTLFALRLQRLRGAGGASKQDTSFC